MDGRLAGAGDRDGMALADRRFPAHGVPHTDRRNDDENRSVRRRRLSCRRGRIPADRRVPFVQGIRSRVTTTAVLQNGLRQLPHHSWIHDGGDWFKLRS